MKSITFNTDMIKAILDGRKTMTRRLMKPQPAYVTGHNNEEVWHPNEKELIKPGYQPGDRLWVREYFNVIEQYNYRWGVRIEYRDGVQKLIEGIQEPPTYNLYKRGYPSIHMPRWASRITLEVTAVRCERVQEIQPWDVVAEGGPNGGDEDGSEQSEWFADLWQSIYPGSWERNDWVWVYEFKVVT
jgi:hypothetical protein